MTRRPDFQPPPTLDLRQKGPNALLTVITVHTDFKYYPWVQANEIELVERSKSDQRGFWMLEVKIRGATDFDHDTAIALRLNLTGVSLRMASGGRLWIDGFIAGDDPDAFHVPTPEWSPLKGATKCTHSHCKAKADQHVIVEEGRYIPPPNLELFDRLRGLRVEITTGRAA